MQLVPETLARVQLEATLIPRISLAFHQNAVPVLRELVVAHAGEVALEDLELAISSTPPFVKPVTVRIARIGAGQRYHVPGLDIALDSAELSRLTEAESAEVAFVLRRGEEVLAELAQPVELLARNQWGGIGQVPDLVAAFVQPNDPAIDRVLKKAAAVLREHGKDPALDGYTKGSKARAWELCSAVWSAVCSLGLDYALPPASFEREGQKVRSPSQILDGGVATCMDTTLLFAASLEQGGLNPVIVFTRGHAFVGCWLQAEDFSSAVVDDVTALRKRVKLKEMVLFETTLAAQRPAVSFARTCERGEQQVSEAEEDKFELAVDIRRCRMQRIRPLASGEPAAGSAAVADEVAPEPVFDEAPDLPEQEIRLDAAPPEAPQGRLARWQRKLLDLSLRNTLLNFRAVKRSVVLDAPEPGRLEDLLAEGHKLQILPRPDLMDGTDPRSAALHEARHAEDARRGHALDALRRDQVLVGLGPDELDSRLVELYRTARANLQEGGANTLFLALGFLAWKRDDKEDKRYRAPLILVPVTLERKSVNAGFRLTLLDDEPRFNPTLLQMLRQDFGLTLPVAEGELPKDESGLDIDGIWREVRHAIKDVKGWEVTEDVVLSTFSFAKYLMWKDLVDRTDQLKLNPVVRHLIDTPRDPYGKGGVFLNPRELDRTHEPAATFCPLPSDSSQLSAVMAGAAGKDFVLVGPPGTGKSQTIANLVAQCLAENKTVLFVSEKVAALDVVYRRLREVGLGEFCLELHSNKARKLDVLQQLGHAWEAKGEVDAAAWAREAEKLKERRNQLNVYVEHLHRKRRNGLTAFQAIGRVVAGREVAPVALSWPSPDAHDEPALDRLREVADRLDVDAAAVGTVAGSPLAIVATGEWSPGWQQKMLAAAQELLPRCRELEEAAERLTRAAGIGPVPLDRRRRRALAELAEILPQAAGRDWRFVLRPDIRSLRDRLAEAVGLVRKRAALWADLSQPYRPDAATHDVAALRQVWADAGAAWWPKSAMLRGRVRKTLAGLCENPSGAKPDCGRDLGLLAQIRDVDRDLEEFRDLESKTGGLWSGLGTRLPDLESALAFQEQLAPGLGALGDTPEAMASLRAAVERLLGDANPMLDPTTAVGSACADFLQVRVRFEAAAEALAGLVGCDDDAPAFGAEPGELAATCQALVAQGHKLNAWCAWRRVRAEASVLGLETLAAAIETGSVAPGRAREVFEVNYCRWWIDAVVDGDDVLRGFVSHEHERLIDEFRALDNRFTELTRAWIRARLCAGMPDADGVARNSGWGLLRRELQKKKRHIPLRQLVSGIPDVLTKLAPCVLMSPLSIAQYLDAKTAPFDLVVFDEASQIPVWDAIGAIARGKNLVIVGDPKQLPPTSFFDRAEDESDDDVDVEGDMESILDECLGASLPTMTLNWHYRSKHESLIAFSNHRYYGGGLVTFPSPVTEDRAVSLHYVADGVYEKGGARINKPEARALVADLVGRLKDPDFLRSGFSIGVVTFNSEQQRLIEDLLDEERRKDPSIETFFSDERLEPVFVKNLESVQGDERDLMYFSITYGPDAGGHVSMNFGPMNRDGGERRLNVAVTRARHGLKVFSALKAEKIDLSRTQALGVRDLKHFLEFAERGPRALAEAVFGTVGSFDSPFEEAVAQALAAKGWQVHPQVGVSAFRIDLGVVDPDAPGRYLAGVECDGATYHRSATARDRDKLREQVLCRLGWQIVRIWSTDWWINQADSLAKTDEKLRALLEASRAARAAEVRKLEEMAVEAAEAAAEAEAADEPTCLDDAKTAATEPAPRAPVADDLFRGSDLFQPLPYARRAEPASAAAQPEVFAEADLSAFAGQADPDRFYEPDYDAVLVPMISQVIAAEGPVRDDVLARRIAKLHGFGRAGGRIRERVLELASRSFRATREGEASFLCPAGSSLGVWDNFRRPAAEPRPIDEIAMAELEALAREVRAQHADETDPILAMARLAGLQRLRAPTRERLESAWRMAVNGDVA